MPSGRWFRRDLPEVVVDDMDTYSAAVKLFLKRFKSSGIRDELTFRSENPSRPSRRKEKTRRALYRQRRAADRS